MSLLLLYLRFQMPPKPKEVKSSQCKQQYVSDGLPVKLMAHGSHPTTESIWDCALCGKDLADYLDNTLCIGELLCFGPTLSEEGLSP
jgi:hypothetical protein